MPAHRGHGPGSRRLRWFHAGDLPGRAVASDGREALQKLFVTALEGLSRLGRTEDIVVIGLGNSTLDDVLAEGHRGDAGRCGLRHGEPPVTVRLWAGSDRIDCTVTDLSHTITTEDPTFIGHQRTLIWNHLTHEETQRIGLTKPPYSYKVVGFTLCDHSNTHVDAINHVVNINFTGFADAVNARWTAISAGRGGSSTPARTGSPPARGVGRRCGARRRARNRSRGRRR